MSGHELEKYRDLAVQAMERCKQAELAARAFKGNVARLLDDLAGDQRRILDNLDQMDRGECELRLRLLRCKTVTARDKIRGIPAPGEHVYGYFPGERRDEEGRASADLRRRSIMAQLHMMADTKPTAVRIAGCQDCSVLAGRVLPFKEALRDPPAPSPDCTHRTYSEHPACVCLFVPLYGSETK